MIQSNHDSTKISVRNGETTSTITTSKSAATAVYKDGFSISITALCKALGYVYTYNSEKKIFAMTSPKPASAAAISADDFVLKIGEKTINLTTASASDIVRVTGSEFKHENSGGYDYYVSQSKEARFLSRQTHE